MQLGETAQFQVRRINEISLMARTTWFGLLAYLAFVGVTLLAVEDADFFVPARKTGLPIVGVDIPTASFFWFAPALGAALYAYLHLQLIKLWDALADADPRPGHRPLATFVYPWLINDLALSLRPGAGRALPLRLLAGAVTGLLVWAAGPLVLAGFWVRSWPAHDELLTHFIGLCLLVTLYVGAAGGWWLSARLSGRRDPAAFWRGFWVRVGALAVLVAVAVIGDLRSQAWALTDRWLARADLRDVQFIPKPADWRDYRTARRNFRDTWCRREGLGAEICGRTPSAAEPPPPHQPTLRTAWCAEPQRGLDAAACTTHFARLEGEFRTAWEEEWRVTLAALDRLNLSGRDLRGALMHGAYLANVDLEAARLEGAQLFAARLEGANLSRARLDGANLDEARLDGANLNYAWLRHATLNSARMEGATLAGARLDGASLARARMERAILSGARLERAYLGEARMDGAILSGARMKAAELVGVWMEGTILVGAWMERANLAGARMEGASLFGAWILGARLDGARMEGADCTGAAFLATLVHGGDVVCRNLVPSHLRYAVGDHRTRLPPGLHVWSCLDRSVLSDPAAGQIEAALARVPGESAPTGLSRGAFERLLFCDPDSPNLMRRDQYPIPVLPGRPH